MDRKPSSPRRATGRLLLLAVLPACAGSDAGEPAAADAAEWRLGQPRVTIGASDEPAHQLDRVYGALVRPDGSILIGNSGSSELRLFDAAGKHLRTAGGVGSGPGEFRGINWMRPYRGDSTLVYDMRARRFSVWDPAGAFARTFRMQSAQGSPRPVGVFSDGSVLVALESQYDPRRGAGVVRDEIVLSRVSPEGEMLRELGGFAGAEWLVYDHPASFRATQLPFGKQAHVAVTGDHFIYGSSESDRLSVHDTAGRVVRTIQLPVAVRKLSRGEIRAHLAEIEDRAEREALRRYLEANAASMRVPAFSDLRADRQGNLWVQTTASSDATGLSRWLVLTPSGERVGSLDLSAGDLPLDILSDAVLVRETDENGVQRVSLREVVR